MTTFALGWPFHSDIGVSFSPALSGGSWSASLPLVNLQDRRIAKVARSSNALAASTTFDVDLGVARDIGVLAILVPNLTKSATPTIRWRGSTVANFASTVYDSGAVAAWPTGLSAEDASGLNVWTITYPATVQTARYWRCDLVDTANTDGYLDVARVVIAGKYQPSVNLSNSAKAGIEDDTIRTVTDGGAAQYQVKRRRRMDNFSVNSLTQTEVFANVRKMQRLLGKSGQTFFIFDPADTTLMYERSYLCVMRELGPLDYADANYMGAAFALVEEL